MLVVNVVQGEVAISFCCLSLFSKDCMLKPYQEIQTLEHQNL